MWDLEKVKEIGKWNKKSEILNMKWSCDNESVLFIQNNKKQLKLFDVRTGKDEVVKSNLVVENFVQSKTTPQNLYIADESGKVEIINLVNPSKNNVTKQIHEKEITGMQYTSNDTLITNSLDGNIKILDKNLVQLKEMAPKASELYGSSLHPENPNLFACGSAIGEVVIWFYD